MKKTFLLLSAVVLLVGTTLISCGDDEDGDSSGPTIYTVKFLKADGSEAASIKVPKGGTLGENYPTDETLGVTEDTHFLAINQYDVYLGWCDQDNNPVLSWTPVTKNLTVKPTFYSIPASDSVTVGTDTPLTFKVKLVADASAQRIRGHKYLRLVKDGGLVAGLGYKIEANYKITSPTGFHFVSFTSSIDQYGWHADWLNEETKEGSLSLTIMNTVPENSETPAPFLDDALHFFVDYGQDNAGAATFAGQEITVELSKLLITEEVPPDVTFNLNGGTYNGSTADIVATVPKGKVYAASELPWPTKTDKYFKGWSSDSSGTPQVDPTTITLNDDATFYAIWADAEYVTSLGTGNQIQGIPVSTYDDDAYIEVVYEGTSPGTTYGLGALCDASWNNIIMINTPPTSLGTGTVTYKIRFLVKTVKAAVGDTLVINNWESNLVGVGANLVTFTAPPEVPEIPVDATVIWKAGDGTSAWTLPAYQYTVTEGTSGELIFTIGSGTYDKVTVNLGTPIDATGKSIYAVVKGEGTEAMKYVLITDDTHGSENNTLKPTSADSWQTLSASNFWALWSEDGSIVAADLANINKFRIAFEQASYSWSLYAVYLK